MTKNGLITTAVIIVVGLFIVGIATLTVILVNHDTQKLEDDCRAAGWVVRELGDDTLCLNGDEVMKKW